MLKNFISYYKPYKKLFVLDLLVASVSAACDLFYPMLTRKIVNETIPNQELRMIATFSIVLLIIYLVKMMCAYFMQYWGHVVGVRMQGDMRKDIYKHLQNLPVKYFDNNQTGSIMSRIVNDLMDISELAHHGPEDLFISIIMIIGSFILLSNINLKLTLIIFSVLLILIIFAIFKRKKMQAAFL
uniref:ABC transporter ATP-binding protein n=1 Tax=uncultured Cetobacterium sp. TaxID=527638 RepID=UPI0026370763